MKINKEIIVNELLADILDWGLTYTEAKSANASKWQLTERTFDRYWSEAISRFKLATQSEQKVIEEVRLQAVKDRALKSILSKDERMEILTQIARGEIPLKKHVVVSIGDNMGSAIQEVEVVPNWMDRKAAIAELNKMDGEYAPVRKDITSGGEQLPAPIFKIILDDGEL